MAASYVNLERVIEKDFGRHELDHRFYSYLRSSMVDRIDPLMLALDCVPVVTGISTLCFFFSLIERKTENQDTLALSRTEL